MPGVEPWPLPDGGCACDLDATEVAAQVELATDVLWELSGRRFGYTTSAVRPVLEGCCGPDAGTVLAAARAPYMVGACGACRGPCRCGHPDTFTMPPDTVEVTGVIAPAPGGGPAGELDTAAWHLAGRVLVRDDGGTWPPCQDLCAPVGAPGTWSLAYRHGHPVPPKGSAALCALCCELAKAAAGQDCQLPERVTSISRQGVSWTMTDPMEFLDKGRTGLYAVDLFISSVNPNRLQRAARVYRADTLCEGGSGQRIPVPVTEL